MKAVILAAGKGVRLQPLTLDRPKQLVNVLERPIIDHILNILPAEISEIIMVIGYRGEMLREHIGASWRSKPVIYIEQTELSGTYPAVCLARQYLDPEESFLVIFADDLYDRGSLQRLLQYPRGVLVHEVKNPHSFGIVLLDEEGKIIDIEEKPLNPKSDLAVTGAYVLDKYFFEYSPEVHPNGEYYFPPVILKMIKDHPMYAERAETWIPIASPQDITTAEDMLQKGEVKI